VLGPAEVVKTFGAAKPVEGTYMASVANVPSDGAITIQTCVPAGTTGLRFAWKLYSEEFKEWCGSQYQDAFSVRVTKGDATTTVFSRTINELCGQNDNGCTTCGSAFVGLAASDVDLDQGGAWTTPWQVGHADLGGALGGAQASLKLTFQVTSAGDAIFETLVLLDDIEFVSGCTPSCGTKVCGSDGCGGQCGYCFAAAQCVDGKCQCTGSCTGKSCGDDGCGGSCGTCATGQTCQSGKCATCQPSCTNKQCGDNGCGGSCGQCGTGTTCSAGACVSDTSGFGKVCDTTQDCDNGLVCTDFIMTGMKVCTKACTTGADCPAGWQCLAPLFGYCIAYPG
jgi:hypothetical protein